MKKPFFYDITLRDGNQSLKKPWNTAEKEVVFERLVELGVHGVEVGFAAASDMDFESCERLAKIAPDNMVIASLARCTKGDIDKAVSAIKEARRPRVHIFLTLSPFHMKYVLEKEPDEVRKIATEAVLYAKEQILKVNPNGEVQFSVEHFGNCESNLDFVTDSLKDIIKAGATTINLPNTVERTRIKTFVDMVEKVYNALPKDINISVHNHNDLGMATAATVEGYFAGAIQLECCLNGLGERAGNTNFYEVAIALHNSGVDTGLDLSKIYETALIVAQMSKVEIPEKAPLIGPDALAHRSGIHQDGAVKTKDLEMGAYRPINPVLIGRKEDEILGFTSQSGKTAIYEIITKAGYPISIQEAIRIAPIAKEVAEKVGELPTRNLIDIYFKEVFEVKGPFERGGFKYIEDGVFELSFKYKGDIYQLTGHGNGPLDAYLDALKQAGFPQKLLHYEQFALDEEILGAGATAMSVIHLEGKDGKEVIARAKDENTAKANVKAIFNALNLIYKDRT